MTRKNLLAWLHHRPVPLAGVLAVVLAAVEVLCDWGTWIELNVSIVFSLPLILAAATRSRRLLWGLALGLVGMTFAVYVVQRAPGAFSVREPFFDNRLLAAMTVLLTAGLLHAWTLALDALEAQGRSLQEQNKRLDAANRKLVCCQEEITRQNEELDRRRQEAEEASGRKTQLLASVSHDLRSPLNAINLMAQVIGRAVNNPALAAEVPGLAHRLQANARSLADLLSDVLDISSFDTGRTALHESEFSLNELLVEECHRLLPLAQAKKLELSAEPPDDPIWLRSDRVKLGRVLGNLVSNAIKFTEQGSVTVTVDLLPEHAVLIRVRDTGIGIAPEDRERIFDEFAQLCQPGRDPNKGWGLGLAICRRLVEAMGGAITVESQQERGTTFSVRLPAACVLEPTERGMNRTGREKPGARLTS